MAAMQIKSEKDKMRGLHLFITDMRNCRSREQEEKRVNKEMTNIRAKFKEGNLKSYDKKKYVCKMLYMYILGWDIDFGHMEAVNLITGTKYTEKQIGYLAVTLLLTENHDLTRMVVNSMRNDLNSMNEVHNCLALTCIANVGGREMAESLHQDVQKLLVSGNSRNFVKKKAALCLLRLYRKNPDAMSAGDWADRVVALMDDDDYGVALSVTTLVLTLCQAYPNEYQKSVSKAIRRLEKIARKEYPDDYNYSHFPAPWLQVQCLRLLQYYPAPTGSLASTLNDVIEGIIRKQSDDNTKLKVNGTNALNATIFEATNLAIHLDPESELVRRCTSLLGTFISHKESNLRYLGLETLANVALSVESLEGIKQHTDTVLHALRDRDISVRRRGLDMLYAMCDASNSRRIVSELQNYLAADYGIRDELVLKIAILAERFATDYAWYVDVILTLIANAGDHVPEEVWYRVVHIITNNEDLQHYAAMTCFRALLSPSWHETAVKVAGYILGEFGDLIANDPGSSPIEMFRVLHSKFGSVSLNTRALLLSTYIKLVNLFPEISSEVEAVFRMYSDVLDIEVQQRACEYMGIKRSQQLLELVCEEMPLFEEKEENALASLVKKKEGQTTDRRIHKMRDKKKGERTAVAGGGLAAPPSRPREEKKGPSPQQIEKWYSKLVTEADGVLYEDDQIQIGYKSEYVGSAGRAILFFGNKTPHVLEKFVAQPVQQKEPVCVSMSTKPFGDSIPPKSQPQQLFDLQCLAEFDEPSMVSISFTVDGVPFSTTLRLPVVITKFIEPVTLVGDDFFARWKQIGPAPKEVQLDFPSPRPIELSEVKKSLTGFKLQILEGVDPNVSNIVASGIFTTTSSKAGCLIRLQTNVSEKAYRLTVRTTSPVISKVLSGLIVEKLAY
eukprot:Lithocolla_globosa_v1_NODE_658_length_3496_cov_53.897995.p1 type:complete len:899 gc:universal NODE_658_length_3496_cov_53.897995:2815-119(-)